MVNNFKKCSKCGEAMETVAQDLEKLKPDKNPSMEDLMSALTTS